MQKRPAAAWGIMHMHQLQQLCAVTLQQDRNREGALQGYAPQLQPCSMTTYIACHSQ